MDGSLEQSPVRVESGLNPGLLAGKCCYPYLTGEITKSQVQSALPGEVFVVVETLDIYGVQ